MESKEIQELLKLVNRLELAEFKYKQGDVEFSVRTKFFLRSRAPYEPMVPYAPVTPSVPTPVAVTPSTPETKEAKTTQETGSDAGKATGAEKENLVEIRSPIVGTFYRSPNPEKGPYVKPGDKIEVGSVVCIVEAMKLFNEIESEVAGKVVRVVAEDASPVEYDQLLFLIDPTG